LCRGQKNYGCQGLPCCLYWYYCWMCLELRLPLSLCNWEWPLVTNSKRKLGGLWLKHGFQELMQIWSTCSSLHWYRQIISLLQYSFAWGYDCFLQFSQKMCLSEIVYSSGIARTETEFEGNWKILDPANLGHLLKFLSDHFLVLETSVH
jgi:hypothetical protein